MLRALCQRPFPNPGLPQEWELSLPNLLCFCLAEILNEDGTINRKVLGAKVFGNQVKAGLLLVLNAVSGGCSPLVPGVFSFQPFEMITPSWLYFLTVAWGQSGTDHISVAESAAVLDTLLWPSSCCCLPVPIPVPVAIPISSIPCFSFTQLRAKDLTYTASGLCPLYLGGSVALGL